MKHWSVELELFGRPVCCLSLRSLVGAVRRTFLLMGDPKTRSSLQSRCVLRGCVVVVVMRHEYHLANTLRAPASPVVTESICLTLQGARLLSRISQRIEAEGHLRGFSQVDR